MPSPKKPDHTRLLVQVTSDVHKKADARRRRENTTWSRIVTELLRRWVAGANGAAFAKPLKVNRPATPEGAEMERLAAEWMKDPAYRKAATEKVGASTFRYRSVAEMFAAGAARAGRSVPAQAFAELDDDDGAADV